MNRQTLIDYFTSLAERVNKLYEKSRTCLDKDDDAEARHARSVRDDQLQIIDSCLKFNLEQCSAVSDDDLVANEQLFQSFCFLVTIRKRLYLIKITDANVYLSPSQIEFYEELLNEDVTTSRQLLLQSHQISFLFDEARPLNVINTLRDLNQNVK